eukprot:Hpha_TRINITY_DN13333_c0_g1::TRINITY_DN13333_c0_g1_i2::g.95467::m.95467
MAGDVGWRGGGEARREDLVARSVLLHKMLAFTPIAEARLPYFPLPRPSLPPPPYLFPKEECDQNYPHSMNQFSKKRISYLWEQLKHKEITKVKENTTNIGRHTIQKGQNEAGHHSPPLELAFTSQL